MSDKDSVGELKPKYECPNCYKSLTVSQKDCLECWGTGEDPEYSKPKNLIDLLRSWKERGVDDGHNFAQVMGEKEALRNCAYQLEKFLSPPTKDQTEKNMTIEQEPILEGTRKYTDGCAQNPQNPEKINPFTKDQTEKECENPDCENGRIKFGPGLKGVRDCPDCQKEKA